MGTHPIFESDFDCLTEMYGELGGEVIRELARSKNDVPPYDDTSVREIIDETINITQKNQEALNSTALQKITEEHDFENIPDEDRTVYTNWCIRSAAVKRNKRCLLAYHSKRLEHIRNGLSSRERMFFNQYNMALSKFMRKSGDLDITQHLTPPKSLYVEVTCLEDAGDVELESGERIDLRRNMRYFLPRATVEHLVRQGLLKEIEKKV